MKLIFRPKTSSYEDILAAAQAKRICNELHSAIVEAMEESSGIHFLQKKIYASSGVFRDTHSGVPGRSAMMVPLNTFLRGK